MRLDNDTLKRLKGIGHELKPVVLVGNNGVTDALLAEINRALTDHELIKIKMPAASKQERDALAQQLAKQNKAHLVQSVGRMALLLRQNPKPNPKLSNLARHAQS